MKPSSQLNFAFFLKCFGNIGSHNNQRKSEFINLPLFLTFISLFLSSSRLLRFLFFRLLLAFPLNFSRKYIFPLEKKSIKQALCLQKEKTKLVFFLHLSAEQSRHI